MADRYVLTGVDRNGKRFRKESANFMTIMYLASHYVCRGKLWQVVDGKRKLLKSWVN